MFVIRLEELGNHADPATIIGIIGNKSDLESQRRVSFQEAQDFANLNRLFYFETSAKDSKNVDEGTIWHRLLSKQQAFYLNVRCVG